MIKQFNRVKGLISHVALISSIGRPATCGRVWLSALLAVAASCSLRAAPVTQLKVMSFNIWVQGGLSLSNCIQVIRTTGADLNGGGTYLNQFTMIFDVLLPGTLNWFPFFNTNPGNANNADFYVSPGGALGGPKARGILVPAPPIKASIGLQPTDLLVSWSGGEGPYQLQKTGTLTNVSWQNVGARTNGTNLLVLRDGSGGFFRVLGP